MPYEFRCEDAGAACRGRFTAESEDELEREVAAHLEEKHDVQHVTKTLRNYVRSVAEER